jgi:hypothetical protein
VAFVCTVSPTGLGQPSFLRSGSSYCGLFDIGYDDLKGVDYKGMVALEPIPGSTAMEYVFFVLEVDRRTGGEHAYWSGRDTSFMRKADRKLVLAAFATATLMLLATVRPMTVDRVTRDPSSEGDRWLDKHLFIQRVFEENGYVVVEAGTAFGNLFWRMERRGGGDVASPTLTG